ncbi:MAG: Gfo/Idh/MocA family oxidoreductase [Ferruginibacter sp.]|nr:Gfo/Idh/MocA family oxidoreductase [Ferruginibacter sp.]
MNPTFAIIGCGRIARRHAEQMNKTGTLVAVCDIVPENAAELAREYGAKIYLSIEELLAKEPSIDIVGICTPNGLHAAHSILCLKAGKHVLCEKPLCISVADAKDMVEAANRYDRKLFVVKQNRYNPPVQMLKALLEDDKLGNIFSFQVNCFWNRPNEYYTDSWKGTKDMDGGTLFTQFSHFIDILYWLLGDVKEVKAITRNFEHPTNDIDDSGVVIIEMLGGAIGTLNYTVNSFQKNMEGSFTVFGKNGTVKIGGQYLNTIEYQCIDGMEIVNLPQGRPANSYGFYQGSMSNHDKVYENLIRALHEPGYEFASALDGLKTVEIIEKIYAHATIK